MVDSCGDEICAQAHKEWDDENYAKAADYFENAIEKGCSSAINDLAFCYASGLGRKRDINRAIGLYRRGARIGQTYAMGNLARLYRDNDRVDLSKKWFLKAISAGDPGYALDLVKLELMQRTRKSSILAYQHLIVAQKGAASGLLSEAEEDELKELVLVVRDRLVDCIG
jgi:TPR repeat protein